MPCIWGTWSWTVKCFLGRPFSRHGKNNKYLHDRFST